MGLTDIATSLLIYPVSNVAYYVVLPFNYFIPRLYRARLVLFLIRLLFGYLVFFSVYRPKTTTTFLDEYDYIIVGAGSAGSVVASRLSEDPCVKVLLLEAGPEADMITELPLMATLLQNGDNDYGYKSVPQKRGALMSQDQKLCEPRGKGLGGTSLLNFMFYVRGNKMDYDTWENQGCTGWSYKDVLPYFLKPEDNQVYNNTYHSQGGYLTVQDPQYDTPLMKAFADAGQEMGFNYGDVNAENQTGFFRLQTTTRDGKRCSTAKAFLIPAQDRPNLDIVINAFVYEVLIDSNNTAYGVKVEYDGKNRTVRARKEVIVCGGTINSPQLLMLSGIGPKEHLDEFNITVKADLPVGNNLQDHVGTVTWPGTMEKGLDVVQTLFLYYPFSAADFFLRGKGTLTIPSATSGMAFMNSEEMKNKSLNWPDLQIHIAEFSPSGDFGFDSKSILQIRDDVWTQIYKPYVGKKTFLFYPCVLRPKSRGTVRLASANAKDAPLIDKNLFENEDDLDKLAEVLQRTVELVNTTAFQNIGAKLFDMKFPGCDGEEYELHSYDYLKCVAKMYTFTFWHPVGTCKMGAKDNKTSVVDPQLKVIGVLNLRVVDGSVIPNQVSANTNNAIIMVAEKASDMIKDDNPDRKNCTKD